MIAALPLVAILALSAVLDGFDLVDATLEPLVARLFDGVGRIAVTSALARALLAPGEPRWRLVGPEDPLCGRLSRLVVAIVSIMASVRLIEQIEETVQAALSVAITYPRRWGAGLRRPRRRDAARFSTRGRRAGERGARLAVADEFDGLRGGGRRACFLRARLHHLRQFFHRAKHLDAGGHWRSLHRGDPAAGGHRARFLTGRAARTGGGERARSGAAVAATLRDLAVGRAHAGLLGVAALLVLAPFGVELGDFLADLQSSFSALKIADVTISPSGAFSAVVLFAITLAAAQGLRRWLDGSFLPSTRLDMGLRSSIVSSVGYAGFILAASVALGRVGLGFEKLALIAGGLSLGVGLGLQSVVNNFVSGLILLWERAIRVGDWVVMGDDQGYVKRIDVRSTEIETFDRATMIVPNSNLVTGVVKNWLRDNKVGRIKIALAPHSASIPRKSATSCWRRRARGTACCAFPRRR